MEAMARKISSLMNPHFLVTAAFLFFAFALLAEAVGPPVAGVPDVELFLQAVHSDKDTSEEALEQIASAWKNNYAVMILDLTRAIQWRRDASPISRRLVRFLEKQTGKQFGGDLVRWWEWVWSLPYDPHPDYALFKGILYSSIDPNMRHFFPSGVSSLIRLDEVDWGGVLVNGIPPLIYPNHFAASEARYLKDSHIVFGLAVKGEARAYPRRILAWHEMARDRIQGVELTIVYCTLCGTVIPYESEVEGELLHFGTSGFLYRSNKLMFDEESMSLWSSLEGKPVIGSRVGSHLQLRSLPVVTTTWGEWKAQHPDTTVLSLETGHQRDYSEGAAYRAYFSTDRLMFPVSKKDRRLKNKQEVLVMLLDSSAKEGAVVPLAISTRFLKKHPLYHGQAAGQGFVVITSAKGANRVYSGTEQFVRRLGSSRVEDARGRIWKLTEDALVLEEDPRTSLPRLSAQRAFWFGWFAQFPDTLLIK